MQLKNSVAQTFFTGLLSQLLPCVRLSIESLEDARFRKNMRVNSVNFLFTWCVLLYGPKGNGFSDKTCEFQAVVKINTIVEGTSHLLRSF